LNNRSVEMAKKYNVELEVLSSLTNNPGTIVKEAVKMEKMLISGVAKDDDTVRISVVGLPDEPGIAFKIFSRLAAKNINIDIILQSVGRDGKKDITFTTELGHLNEALEIVTSFSESVGAEKVIYDTDISKVSIVGAGMETHAGVASQMFEALYGAGINIQMIATSEIKISVLINKKDSDKAVAALHAAFFG
ncbi:MAG: ACT domain-containing protein, partial [Clostridia bacterium]|nr:ACT domain-containing protein [Clostridia bacterium]